MKYINAHKQKLICLLIIGIFIVLFVSFNKKPGNTQQNTEQNKDIMTSANMIKDTSKLEQLLKEEENIKDRSNLSEEFIQTHPGETL